MKEIIFSARNDSYCYTVAYTTSPVPYLGEAVLPKLEEVVMNLIRIEWQNEDSSKLYLARCCVMCKQLKREMYYTSLLQKRDWMNVKRIFEYGFAGKQNDWYITKGESCIIEIIWWISIFVYMFIFLVAYDLGIHPVCCNTLGSNQFLAYLVCWPPVLGLIRLIFYKRKTTKMDEKRGSATVKPYTNREVLNCWMFPLGTDFNHSCMSLVWLF